MRTATHHNFSITGLLIILILGGLVMISAAQLETIIDLAMKFPRFRNNDRLRFAHAQWQAGATLQVQRLAHEALGLGTWSRATSDVPVTEAGDVLGVLDISRSNHPRLVPPVISLAPVVASPPGSKFGARPRYIQIPSTERL